MKHEVAFTALDKEDQSRLKIICQSISMYEGGLYIVVHSDLQNDACPLCNKSYPTVPSWP